MILYLIGFMASGKTTMGKRLAKRIGYDFVDLDALIVQEINMSIDDFFAMHGENEFRIIEKKVLQSTAMLRNSVVACGGGTPCFFDNMDIINTLGKSIYIKCSPAILYKRLIDAKNPRPLLQKFMNNPDGLRQFIAGTLAQRTPYYTQARYIITSEKYLIGDWAWGFMIHDAALQSALQNIT